MKKISVRRILRARRRKIGATKLSKASFEVRKDDLLSFAWERKRKKNSSRENHLGSEVVVDLFRKREEKSRYKELCCEDQRK